VAKVLGLVKVNGEQICATTVAEAKHNGNCSMGINLCEKHSGGKNRANVSLGNITVLSGASDIILVLRRVGWKVLHSFCIKLRIFVMVFLS